MRRRRRSHAFAFAFVSSCVTAPACSADPTPNASSPDSGAITEPDGGVPGDAGDSIVAGRDYCETIAEFFCGFYVRCGRMVAASEADCQTTFLETCNARYEPRYLDLEAAGLLELTTRGIARCQAHLGTVACEAQPTDLIGPCGNMWRGKAPTGSPCGIDVESFVCAPGNTCVLGLDFCGTCQAAVGRGETCGEGARCDEADVCKGGRCEARALPGEACTETRDCLTASSCVAGKCVAASIVGEGKTCDAQHRCAYRSTCVSGSCETTSLLGGACATDRGCASGRCSDGKCVPLRSPGETCQSSGECSSALCSGGKCKSLPSACFNR